LALDISGAEYYELIAWVRRLGLPESGGVEDLRKRLYAYYKVSPLDSAPKGPVLRIESADKTEYFKLENVGEEYVRLSGGVILVFTESGSGDTHRIKADEVLYNRTTNILSARGSVEYEKTGSSGTETFYGASLTVDLDSWQGRFLDGRSVRSSGENKDESALVFAADEIRKLEGGILALHDGLITSSEAEDPYWAVRASRIWLLGSNEWAIANAVISVGEVPILYLPFFYYPGQEIVFHPALGYRDREGRFFQTTTYLIGEKAADSENDLNLFKTTRSGEGYEKELRGVFLQETNSPKKSVSKDTLKLLADIYSNLGAFIGLDGIFEAKGIIKNLEFSAGFGFSRSIFSDSGYYTPFSDVGGYESVWNSSSLWGLSIPFRYSLNLDTKLSLGPLTATLGLPLVSDVYFNEDFQDRSEDMNWLKIMTGETTGSDPGEISSFTQKITLSGSFPVDGLKPWISSFSLEKFTSSLYWKPITRDAPADADEAKLFAVDPLRKFFAPELLTIADVSLNLRGTLFAFSSTNSDADAKGSKENADKKEGDAAVSSGAAVQDEKLAPPWEEEGSLTAGFGSAEGKPESQNSVHEFTPPKPSEGLASSSAALGGLSGGINYTVTPAAQYERRYPTAYWDEPEDVNGEGLYDLASYKLSATLETKASWAASLLSSSFALGWTSQAQARSNIDSDTSHVSDTQRDSWEIQDARYRYERLTGSFKISSFPLQDFWLWSPTALSYTVVGYLYNTSYQEDSIANYGSPVYDVTGLDWSTDSIKTHNFTFTLGAQPYGYVQSLTLTTTLPPRLESYSMDAKLAFPYVSLQGSTKYYRSAEGVELQWDALTTKITAGLDRGPSISNQFIWDIEDNEPTSNTTTLTWGKFTASLLAKQSEAYELSLDSGWETVGDEAFRLTEATASFKGELDLPLFRKSDIRLKGTLNTVFSQSIIKATESVLALTYGLTLSVPGILDISVSGTSQNSSVWRYAPSWFGMSNVDGITFEPVNVFEDILKAFSIWDRSALKSALFKMKGLSVTATHYMEDWDLVFEYKGGPELNTSSSPYSYEFVSSFTLLLTWKAIPQITTSIIKDDDGFRTE